MFSTPMATAIFAWVIGKFLAILNRSLTDGFVLVEALEPKGLNPVARTIVVPSSTGNPRPTPFSVIRFSRALMSFVPTLKIVKYIS